MNKIQEPTVFAMVTETGAVSIWSSNCILILDFNRVIPKNLALPTAIVILIGASLILVYSCSQNRKSSEFAEILSRSLIESQWSKDTMQQLAKENAKTS
jgi:hypothetical protein